MEALSSRCFGASPRNRRWDAVRSRGHADDDEEQSIGKSARDPDVTRMCVKSSCRGHPAPRLDKLA